MKIPLYLTDPVVHRTCLISLLITSVVADGTPQRGLGANDDVVLTVGTT